MTFVKVERGYNKENDIPFITVHPTYIYISAYFETENNEGCVLERDFDDEQIKLVFSSEKDAYQIREIDPSSGAKGISIKQPVHRMPLGRYIMVNAAQGERVFKYSPK